jgi:hypothetical protein
MERELETMFDTVLGLQASVVDVHQLQNICREQQAITMKRVASWLRMNGRIYNRNCEVSVGKEMSGLADELDYLAEVALTFEK